MALTDPEEEDVSGGGPGPAGRLEVRGRRPPALQLVPAVSKGTAEQFDTHIYRPLRVWLLDFTVTTSMLS